MNALPILLQADSHTLDRFWSKVDRSAGEHSCWDWKACRDRAGYGVFRVRGKNVKSHRFALAITSGPLSQDVLHKCGNTSCCNPAHLREGTDAENTKDRIRHGTVASWERNGRAKLDRHAVARLRAARSAGASLRKLGSMFGIGKTQVRRIVLGEHWRQATIEGELVKQGWKP